MDGLGGDDKNGTATSTASAISRFDDWFTSQKLFEKNPNKPELYAVFEKMLLMNVAFPPFIRVCNLGENDRGTFLAHFLKEVKRKNGIKDLKANSKGLLMTAFQRAFHAFDANRGFKTLSMMTMWKKHRSYKGAKSSVLYS